MPRTSDKRQRLLEAARALIHRQGFYSTTLADIAREAGVALGNVYYYFKTKEEIATAVITAQQQDWDTAAQQWDALPDARQRLLAMLDDHRARQHTYATNGCPVAGLCAELNRERSVLSQQAAALVKQRLAWLTNQFRALGRADAIDLAAEFLATLQGVALLANTLQQTTVVERQLRSLQDRVTAL